MVIALTCPTTKRPFTATIAIDPADLERIRAAENWIGCEHCGDLHSWSAEHIKEAAE